MPNKFERISRQKLREQLIADYLKRKEEEIKESIAGKMRTSNLNDKVRLTKIRQVAEVRQKYEAIHNKQ